MSIEFDSPMRDISNLNDDGIAGCKCDLFTWDTSCLAVANSTLEFFPGRSEHEFCGWPETHDLHEFSKDQGPIFFGSYQVSGQEFSRDQPEIVRDPCTWFSQRTCATGSWIADPQIPEIDGNYRWHLPPHSDPRTQSDNNLTCAERKKMGPDRDPKSILSSMPLWFFFSLSSAVYLCSIKLATCYGFGCDANCGAVVMCCGSMVSWGSWGLGVLLLPIMLMVFGYEVLSYEKSHTYNMNRQILFCAGDIGFTWFTFPFFLAQFAMSVKSLRSPWPDPHDPAYKFGGCVLTLPYVGIVTQRHTWLQSQVSDLFMDVGTLVLSLASRPYWFSMFWTLALLSSLATLCVGAATLISKTDETAFRKMVCLNLFTEHLPQICLGLYSIFGFSGPQNEFIAYSLLTASLQAIKISLQQVDFAKSECCKKRIKRMKSKSKKENQKWARHPLLLEAPLMESM